MSSRCILGRCDFVIAAVHDRHDLSREAQTRRVVRALENPWTTILGHPTGRVLFDTPALELDLGVVFAVAAQRGVAVEIDGRPQRMDPDGAQIRMARDKGALLCVSPGAHDVAGLRNVEFAVGLARRGCLGPEHVLNTWETERVAQHFESRRTRKGGA